MRIKRFYYNSPIGFENTFSRILQSGSFTTRLKGLLKEKAMIAFIAVALCFGLSLSCTYPIPAKPDMQPVGTPAADSYVDAEIIVKADAGTALSEIDKLIPGVRMKTVSSIKNNRFLSYRLFDKQKTDITLISLLSSGKVMGAEKNAVYSLFDYVPDDPAYALYQYAPRIAGCETGWDIEKGDGSVIVAELDTGINGEHEDLLDRVVGGRNIITGDDIASGANSDDIGHGTHVAGIIGAIGNNGKGIAGVAWNVKLMPVKIFSPGVATTTTQICEGIVWAIDHGAKVINMSLGGGIYSVAIHDAVNYAHEKNVVIVAAMGNDFKAKVRYPAALPGVIAVGSTNGRDEVSFYSTRGTYISVSAPGEDIYSLLNTSNTGYTYMSGTSMATPFVSGLVALLLSHEPALSQTEVRSMIEDSADPLGADKFSPAYGYGRVNVGNALSIGERDNYGAIQVDVTNKGKPVGGVKVLVRDSGGNTLQSGMTSFGGTSGGINGRIVFNDIRTGNYKVTVQVGTTESSDISIAGNSVAQTSFSFDTPMVLLVNAIKKADNAMLTDEYLYTRKLSGMGKYYTTWKTAFNGVPPSGLVDAYDTVVWFTGRTQDDPDNGIEVMTDEETAVIGHFLDKGGRLYLCGNNIAEHLSKTDHGIGFLGTYLHASYIGSPLSHDELFGTDFLDAMDLMLAMEDDDQIDIGTGSAGILDSSDVPEKNDWAGLRFAGAYRLVFTTPCPNEILYGYPDTFFENIINWLESGN